MCKAFHNFWAEIFWNFELKNRKIQSIGRNIFISFAYIVLQCFIIYLKIQKFLLLQDNKGIYKKSIWKDSFSNTFICIWSCRSKLMRIS